MEEKQVTYSDIIKEKEIPAIAIDHEGIIFLVNDCFEKEYGWAEEDLIGSPVTTIMPPYMRDAHNIGFSRFLGTGTQRILYKEIELPIYCKDETIRQVTHYITGKEENGKWQFAALIDPG